MVECPKCGESFGSEQAMEQHLEDYDHENTENRPSLKEKIMHSNLAGIAIIAILVVGVGFLGVSIFSGSGGGAGNAGSQLSVGDDPVLGTNNASVVIAYFGDYGCPICNRFEQRVFPQLKSDVVEEGEARFVKKNFPVVTHNSPRLAEASQAVWEQTKDSKPEKFWEWHAHIYDNQGHEGSGWATRQRILELTKEVDGIDAGKVEKALEQNKYSGEVNEDLREGRNAGVRGTPTFIIYNSETGKSEKLVGPQPVSRFRAAINMVK